MVFRFLIRLFSNNEHLVRRLSESYPVRKAAQVLVQAFVRGKEITEDSGIQKNISQLNLKSFLARFTTNVKTGFNEMKEEYRSHKKR